ncbi:major facilitator superfamily domain-containing protein [Hysterangium stoloniferum]|nr:major facilitator superfamily domain-containing protein [Hysterangium stoloniferum]
MARSVSVDGAIAVDIPANAVQPIPLSRIPTKDAESLKDADGLQELEASQHEVTKESSDGEYLWNTDTANPYNWTNGRKWKSTAIVSAYTLLPPLASSIMAPALPEIGQHYNITSPTLLNLTLTIFLLAFGLAPLVIAPFSEIYGRVWVLHLSMIFFLAFSFGCIFAPTAGALIAFRFLAGIGGSTPISIGGGVVSDLFRPNERAGAMSLYAMGPVLGPAIGPIAGGFIVQGIGFKWIFAVLTVAAGVAILVGIPLLEETYNPLVKQRWQRKVERDSEAMGVKQTVDLSIPPPPKFSESIRENLSRPLILLTRSLTCFMLSLYVALLYGYLYLMFTTFPDLFSKTYGWGVGVSGLAYLGPGLGFFVGNILGAPMITFVYVKLSERNGGTGKPEYRIPLMCFGSLGVPIGLFWYAWSAQAAIHWFMPMFGCFIFAFGMMMTYLTTQLYLVDAFTYAASALSAAATLRALFGFVFPLFGEQMFAKLGTGGGNSLLAGLAILTGIPFPIFLWFKGEQMRLGNPLNR